MKVYSILLVILIAITGFAQTNDVYSGVWTNNHDKTSDYVFELFFEKSETQSVNGTLQYTQKRTKATMGTLKFEGRFSDKGQIEIDIFDRYENEMTRASLNMDESSVFLVFKQLDGYIIPMLPEEIQLTKIQSQ